MIVLKLWLEMANITKEKIKVLGFSTLFTTSAVLLQGSVGSQTLLKILLLQAKQRVACGSKVSALVKNECVQDRLKSVFEQQQ